MATTSEISIPFSDRVGFISLRGQRTPESFQIASELLTDNHVHHHVFFNDDGFHNHSAHHLLTSLSLGAPPPLLSQCYTSDSTYQRPLSSPLPPPPTAITPYLGNRAKYPELLAFFKHRIDTLGMPQMLHETFFAGTPEADDMLYRLFAGLVHPWIHLGFGVEFKQPAIIAEAAAMAASSGTKEGSSMSDFLRGTEEKAKDTDGYVGILALVDEIRATEKVRSAAKWEDGDKIAGVMERARDEIVEIAAKFRVRPDKKEFKRVLAESISSAAAIMLLAQRPSKSIRFDFFLMHALTSSLFLHPILSLDCIDDATRVRTLELKVRTDLMIYASRGAPELRFDELREYVGRAGNVEGVGSLTQGGGNPRVVIVERVLKIEDDGHVGKTVRALLAGAVVEREWLAAKEEGKQDRMESGTGEKKGLASLADEDGLLIKGDLWLKAGEMVVDAAEESVERGEESKWARNVGFDEAWEGLGERVSYGEKKE